MRNPNSYISMLWNKVYSVHGMFRRVSKCRRNLHTTLELELISMTSRHPETRPPAVAAWIGHGTFADRYPGGRISKRCCYRGHDLNTTCWKNWKFAWKLRESSVFGSGNPKHHGVARIDLHTTCQVPPDKTGVHLLSLVGARSLD